MSTLPEDADGAAAMSSSTHTGRPGAGAVLGASAVESANVVLQHLPTPAKVGGGMIAAVRQSVQGSQKGGGMVLETVRGLAVEKTTDTPAVDNNICRPECPSSRTVAVDDSSGSTSETNARSTNSTGRGGTDRRVTPQGSPPLSAAEKSEVLTLATCSAQERMQRILEMKKLLDQYREDDLAESSTLRSTATGGGAASGDLTGKAANQTAARDPMHTQSILDMFAVLSQVEINREVLSKTRIGVSVGKLRSHASSLVRSRASELVVKWKACIGVAASAGGDAQSPTVVVGSSASPAGSCPAVAVAANQSSPTPAGSVRPPSSGSNSREGIKDGFAGGSAACTSTPSGLESASAARVATGVSGNSGRPKGSRRSPDQTATGNDGGAGEKEGGDAAGGCVSTSSVSNNFRGPLTGDSVRDRARMFLWRALLDGMQQQQQGQGEAGGGGTAAAAAVANGGDTAAHMASQVEEALWEEYCVRRRSTKQYTAQLKTLKWNLADPKNPDLNLKVLCGVFTPEQLATMTSAELASDEKKRLREQQKKESMEACQSDWEMKKLMQGAGADGQFPCFKCRTTKTVYVQMQTRSSDEPMTTFVTCLECGNRWKF